MSAQATRTLPWSWYADAAVLEVERERILRRAWHYAGHTGELAEPGAFRATSVAGVPTVLVRGEDGVLRALLNVCRHRGSLVCEGEGVRASLQCPYHAWTYGLDGRLLRAPRLEREGPADADELALVQLRLETWGPFVFVSADRDAPPLAEHLDGVPELLAEAGLDVEALRFAARMESEIAANWKLVAENFLECYHCPVAHRGFSSVVDVSPDAYELETGRTRLTQLGAPRPEPRGAYDPRGEVERGQFHLLFPGTVLNVMPGRPNLSIGPIVPLAADRTYRLLDYFVAPDADEAWLGELLAFDAQVGEEDVRLVERVQRGVASGLLEEGRLLPESERLVARFQALVLEALSS